MRLTRFEYYLVFRSTFYVGGGLKIMSSVFSSFVDFLASNLFLFKVAGVLSLDVNYLAIFLVNLIMAYASIFVFFDNVVVNSAFFFKR